MILPKFSYKKAKNVEDAMILFKKYDGKALYLAGGTDLMPQLKLRLHEPVALIDIKGIDNLKRIDYHEGFLSVGANITLFQLKNDPVVKEYCPALFESLESTSCETLQMRGTIGGNILQNTRCLFYNKSLEWRRAKGFCIKAGGEKCNAVENGRMCFANYCSDNTPSMLTLNTEMVMEGPDGKRRIRLAEIFSNDSKKPFKILPGEIVAKFLIPLEKTKGAFEKIRVRGSIDYPLVNAALSVRKDTGLLSIGGIGPAPLLYILENLKNLNIEELADRVYSDSRPVANATLPPVYRKRMSKALAKRIIAKALRGKQS